MIKYIFSLFFLLSISSAFAMDSWIPARKNPGSKFVSGVFYPSYRPVKTLDNGDNIAWLRVTNPESANHLGVLINYGSAERPAIIDTGDVNFKYINPSFPTLRLPAGLYYWTSQAPADIDTILGKHLSIPVKHRPLSEDIFHFKSLKGYGINSSTPWNPTGYQPFHVDSIK